MGEKTFSNMKPFAFFFLAMLTLLVSQSCNKDDASPNGKMTAKIDGVKWTGKEVGASLVSGTFNLSGKAADGSLLTITLQNVTGADTFFLYPGGDDAAVWLPANATNSYVTNSTNGLGYFILEEINTGDSTVSGKFEFRGEEPFSLDTVEVKEGKFSKVSYSGSTTPVGDNSLSVKIDGTIWAALQVTGTKANGKLSIIGTDANASRTVGLTMPTNVSTGTYTLGNPLFGAEHGGQYNPDNATFLTAASGSLKIAKHNIAQRQIEGEFDFEASSLFNPGTASLTDGSFSVQY
jgi:hypothetical protein